MRPAIEILDMWSQEAEDLVMGTAAQESNLVHLTQLENGPARGLFQMEIATHDDIWSNYLAYRPSLASKIAAANHGADRLIWDLRYAAQMCRVHYYRDPEPIPETLEGQAQCWKRVYNTPQGHGTVEQYIENYQRVMA